VEIDFSDSGIGIAPEALEQIFEPYYSTKDTGIGLGLPLTKKIIEEHGGQITVKSELDKGTTFTVTLPREPG
jgi:signal transduction histidine kinase